VRRRCPECGGPVDWIAEWRVWVCFACWIEIRLSDSNWCKRPRGCGCDVECDDDGDTEGPGVCRGLPLPKKPPLVEVVLVRRDRLDDSYWCKRL
jgi:hypothetical protein